ncbi:hypothetical protein [Marinobacterium stanieri]|uniref:hypothetical protein n=1 Tax=Marinobacterium stanieri TaxID=49186 RepID=UPI003A95A21B
MNQNNSLEFFLRFVKQRHVAVVNASDQLVGALASDNPQSKKMRADKLAQEAGALLSAISSEDRPAWLPPLHSISLAVSKGAQQPEKILRFLLENNSAIRNHKWQFEQDDKKQAFDFDEIFEYYRSESRVPELFENIIQILEEIYGSGEIDSLSMMNALSKLIATLKRSKNGSYFSINSAWEFLLSFLNNYFWTEVSNLPVAGSVIAALKQTIEETNEEMFKLHTKVDQKLKETVESETKGLSKPKFQFLSYDKSGQNISDITPGGSVSGKA